MGACYLLALLGCILGTDGGKHPRGEGKPVAGRGGADGALPSSGAGPASVLRAKTRPREHPERQKRAPSGIMSGRVGDLSPQQQEALARVRFFGGSGRAGRLGLPPRPSSLMLEPLSYGGERGPWRAPLPSRGHLCPVARPLWTGRGTGALLWATLGPHPAPHSRPLLATEPPGACPLLGVGSGKGWEGEGPPPPSACPASGQFRGKQTPRSPAQIATFVWLLWVAF